MRVEVERVYGSSKVKLDLEKLQLAKDLKTRDRRIEELTQQQVHCVIISMRKIPPLFFIGKA